MIKVLHVVTRIDVGGISTFLANYYKYIDKEKISFEVVSIDTGRKQGCHDGFESLGIKVYYMPNNLTKRLAYYFSLLKANNYDIVHSHIEVQSSIYLLLAKLVGVKVRIAHAHMSLNHTGFKNQFMKFLLKNVISLGFGASDLALKSVFDKKACDKYRVINNAVDLQQFYYDVNVRNSYRKELDIENKLVLGFVGRLTYEKNLDYLAKIFAATARVKDDCLLLIIGDGERSEVFFDELKKYSLMDKIKWLKTRGDVNKLMSAIDVLLLPSFSEGLGLVLVESQAVALQAVVSSQVPQMVNLSSYIHYLPIDIESIEDWVDLILKIDNNYERINMSEIITEKKFNVEVQAQVLEGIYLDLLKL